jgi:mutator protein MutT
VRAALALARREIVRFLRQPSRVMGAVAPPLLMWLLIGSGFRSSFRAPGDGGYVAYFFPGTVVLVILFASIFATISVIEDRREGFLQAVLVAPVAPYEVALGKVLGGLWEFPGGKVEAGETDEAALAREVRERVGVDVAVKRAMAQRTHTYDGYTVDLTLYEATIGEGQEPQAVRVAECRWVASSEFERYPFPAADQATTDLLLGIKR